MGRVTLCIVFFLLLLVSVTLADNPVECGSEANDTICTADYACCSRFGFCGFTHTYCSPELGCQSNCVPLNQVVAGVPATMAYLNNYNYDLQAADLQCSKWLTNKTFEWRDKYQWTGFCGPIGPQGRAACGRCLNVTNVATNSNYTILRIVDTCGMGGLTLDSKAFRLLDSSDENGFFKDSLTVNYEFVECGDEIRLLSTGP